MATTTVISQCTNVTAYGSRLATLEVTGISTRNGHQTMSVPLNRLSQTMQQIHRQGGKIISVNTIAESAPVEAAPAPQATPDVEQELAMEKPKAVQQSGSKKKRR